MNTTARFLATLFVALLTLNAARAQTQQPAHQPSQPMVAATASAEQVRYVSMGEVQQTRLQVFSSYGAQVYDSGFRLGNLIDWKLENQQGTRLADGTYLYLVTVRDFSGNVTQKYGTAVLERGEVYLEQTGRDALSSAQAAALEANRQSESLAMVDRVGAAGLNRTTTSVTNGATPTTDIQTSSTTENPELTAGTGTQNRIAKWIDNSGTLDDSIMFDNGVGVGVGTTDLTDVLLAGNDKFKIVDGPMTFSFRDFSSGQGYFAVGSSANGIKGFIGHTNDTDGFTLGSFSNHRLTIRTNSVNRLVIDTSGNVGIGTASPTAKLHVNGAFMLDAASPTLFTGTSGAEQNRYLNLINSPNWPSASGLKAGGILVSDSYAYANPGKNDLIVKGNVGIGINALSVPGLHIGAGVQGGQARLQLDNSNGTFGGLNRWANRLELMSSDAIGLSIGGIGNAHFFIQTNGNIGIGTFGPALISGGTGRMVDIRDPNSPGLALTNTATGGNQYFLYSSSFNSPGTGSFRIYDATSGADKFILNNVVGLGTEVTVRSPSERAILTLDGTLQGQRKVWTLESGLFGVPGLFGIYNRTNNIAPLTIDGNARVFVDGNVGQRGASFGLPKAMLLINPNNNGPAFIEKCYNAVTGSVTGNCDITISQVGGVGLIYLKFPFRATDRFFSLALQGETAVSYSLSMQGFDSNDISGQTAMVSYLGETQNSARFYLIVY